MLIKYSTFEILFNSPDDEIINFLKVNKYRRPIYIDKIIKKIHNHIQLLSDDVEYAYQIEAGCLCEILLVLKKKLKYIEKEMNKITDTHRLGKYFKALPDTAPKNYQSGMYHKVIKCRACNKSARAVLYKFAFSTLQFSTWAREYYDKQRVKGKTNSVA
jgi:transposase IS116/IS110/IS902 family protein